VEHERVHVWPKLSDEERHLVGHEAADEMNVPAEAIQFSDSHVGTLLPRGS
jgi:hypothetical protein